MSKALRVNVDDSCPACGGDLAIYTDAEQPDDGEWAAFDGDEVRCDECDHIGRVSADGETAYLSLDNHDCGCEWCSREDT